MHKWHEQGKERTVKEEGIPFSFIHKLHDSSQLRKAPGRMKMMTEALQCTYGVICADSLGGRAYKKRQCPRHSILLSLLYYSSGYKFQVSRKESGKGNFTFDLADEESFLVADDRMSSEYEEWGAR